MNWAEKTRQGIEDWFTKPATPDKPSWGERIGGWLLGFISKGITKSLEDMEPGAIESYSASLTKLSKDPNTPPEIKAFLDKALVTGNPISTVAGMLIMIVQSIGIIMGGSEPLANLVKYSQELALKTARLDPISAITAWRRDPVKYADVWPDLTEQGWDDTRIEALKFITEVIPGVQDLIRMGVREAFDDDFARTWGMDEEFSKMPVEWAAKQGYSATWSKYSWRAHWDLPSVLLGYEMLHRHIISEKELGELMTALDIMPGWRPNLIKLSWNIPTRVDVRRFWDMRTIDETRLREIYTGLGYHDQDLEDYVLWTKIYVDFPDLVARYKNGWITLDDVKRELIAMGMKPARADTMIQEKMKNAMIERTVTEKNLTKADIISGVKKGVITRAEGGTLLVSIGYSTDEAEFILEVGIPTDEEAANAKIRTLTKSDIAAAVKTQLISPAEAIPKLIALRYKEADATFLAAIYAAQIPIEKLDKERELTKGDVATGLKVGIISPAEATTMLTKLRYSTEDIAFLLKANAAEAAAAAVETARQVEKSDVRAALGAGVITDTDAISRLVKLQYSAADAAWLVNLYNTIDSLSIVTQPKEVSKGDIVTAVKKGLITPSEGYTMLIGLGFSADASNFILSIAAEESPFSPMNFTEFLDRTQKWRLAAGLEGKPMTEEIKKLGAEVVRLSAEVEALNKSIKAEQGKLMETEGLPSEATARVKELQASLYKAQAELTRVKTDYNAKVSEWRHAAK